VIAGASAGIVHWGWDRPSHGPQLLSVDPSPAFTCKARKGDVVKAVFKLENLQKRPITLLGAKTSCPCAVAEGLPVTLAPGDSSKVSLLVKIGEFDGNGNFIKSAELMTNRDGTVPPLDVVVSNLDR